MKVVYTDPTVGDDTNAIQDEAGNDAADLPPPARTTSPPFTNDSTVARRRTGRAGFGPDGDRQRLQSANRPHLDRPGGQTALPPPSPATRSSITTTAGRS